MWKNWFSFRRKEEKQPEPSARSQSNQKVGKENGASVQNDIHADQAGDAASSRRRLLDSSVVGIPGSQPRSPFKSRISYVDNDSMSASEAPASSAVSVLKGSGPLLSTPLLPKIRRAIEMNESLSGHRSSPIMKSRTSVARSASLNYGPTHPSKSMPGRFPIVNLQRRPSLHLITGRKVQSPSTVKVAPPDQSMLAGASFRMSPSVSMPTSPPKTPVVVDTRTVVSALRERSVSRKRCTATVNEDSVPDEDFIQMAKRRRQDNALAKVTPIPIPTLSDTFVDITKPQLSPPRDNRQPNNFRQMEQMAGKRPAQIARRPSFDDSVYEAQPQAKRDKRTTSSRVLSSLSSSHRPEEEAPTTSVQMHRQVPVARSVTQPAPVTGKRTRAESTQQGSPGDTQPVKKALSAPVVPQNSAQQSRPSATAMSSGNSSTSATDKPTPPQTAMTPKKKLLSMMQQNSKYKSNVYPSLGRQATKPAMMMASAADLELDRKEENARRVQDMLAFLDDDDEEGEEEETTDASKSTGFSLTQSATAFKPTLTSTTTITINPAVTSTSAAATTPFTPSTTTATTAVKPSTTASSLSELLSSPLSSTPKLSSSLKPSPSSPALSALASLAGLVSTTSASSSNPTSGLSNPTSGLSPTARLGVENVTGLAQSSGAGMLAGLVDSKPICSIVGGGSGGGMFSGITAPGSQASAGGGGGGLFSGLTPSGGGQSSVASSFASTMNAAAALASLAGVAAASMSSASATTPSGAATTTGSPSQYTFKPVFGVQESTTASPAPNQATLNPQGAGGFSFGGVSQSTTTSQSAATGGFSFGANSSSTQPATSSSGGFSFGGAASQTPSFGGAANSQPPTSNSQSFSFGGANAPSTTTPAQTFGVANTQAPSSTHSFSFGGSGAVTSTASAQPFSFGVGNAPVSSTAGGMNFGQTSTAAPTPANQPAGSGFGFGSTSSQPSTTAPGFNFGGGTSTTSAQSNPASNFSFGGGATGGTSTADPSGFTGFNLQGGQNQNTMAGLGQNTQLASSAFTGPPDANKSFQPKNLFGAPQATNAGAASLGSSGGGFGGFGAGNTAQAGFGQAPAPATTNTGGNFSFGGAQPSTASSSFSFGSGAGANSAGAGGFAFGKTASAPPAGAQFGYGGQTTAGTFSFNQTAAAATTAGTASASPFSFGQTAASTVPGGGASQPFGASATSASTFSFGGAQKAPPATQPTGFSFGGNTSSTAAAPAFGAGGMNASQQPGFGNTAGQPSPFAFNSTQQQQQQQQQPGFGSQPAQPAPAFGSAQPQSQPAPGFGGFGSAAPKPNPAGFNFASGRSSSANPSPAFGVSSTTGQAPAFGAGGGGGGGANLPGSGRSTPNFGASNNNTPVFGASANAVPSAGGSFNFGAAQQTPQKNFNFGATQPSPAPAYNQFGAPAPGGGSVGGGGGGGGGGFDFSSSRSTPTFNFGAAGGPATPGTPASGMFTMGAGSTAPKPKPNSIRPRRRGTRR